MLMPKKDDYYRAERKDIADLVTGETQRVLDVGCACGATGEILKKRGVKEVIGVEFSPHACEEASRRLDKVFLGDIQQMALPFEDGHFDCIIYADVLEHLTDPWTVLKRQSRLLKDKGMIIASIPNIRHYRVVKKLLKGEWDYEERGVLDSTHLRFFTLDSIKKMFAQAGYRIDKLIYKISASRVKKLLNKVLLGRLNESLSEQFLIKAVKI
ncbi:class I SAM-dependent methyltransferase [Omnitrophica bacterium]|nr:class I SAM-dependent methyltransferase [Candidatus Omnitrophota bacterium]